MAEIRLICPECATEYRLPDSVIPETGREVECTACGRVWWASRTGEEIHRPAPQRALPVVPAVIPATSDLQGSAVVRHEALPRAAAQPTEAATTASGTASPGVELPPLNRRLPDRVLSILRDEVEHERKARAAEDKTSAEPGLATVATDPEWPATTITGPLFGTMQQPTEATAPAEPASQNTPVIAAVPIVATPLTAPEKGRKRRPGYGAGFGLAAMVAALAVALYLLAPGLSGSGDFGDGLMQYRQQVDAGRQWLDQQAKDLIQRD